MLMFEKCIRMFYEYYVIIKISSVARPHPSLYVPDMN